MSSNWSKRVNWSECWQGESRHSRQRQLLDDNGIGSVTRSHWVCFDCRRSRCQMCQYKQMIKFSSTKQKKKILTTWEIALITSFTAKCRFLSTSTWFRFPKLQVIWIADGFNAEKIDSSVSARDYFNCSLAIGILGDSLRAVKHVFLQLVTAERL